MQRNIAEWQNHRNAHAKLCLCASQGAFLPQAGVCWLTKIVMSGVYYERKLTRVNQILSIGERKVCFSSPQQIYSQAAEAALVPIHFCSPWP